MDESNKTEQAIKDLWFLAGQMQMEIYQAKAEVQRLTDSLQEIKRDKDKRKIGFGRDTQ